MSIKLTVLLENTSGDPRCHFAHGLSLFLETPGHRILFDTGPDASFLKNAELLAADVENADLCVLSHAHSDHTGGLRAFLRVNTVAQVYARPEILGHYGSVRLGEQTRENGLAPDLKHSPRLRLTQSPHRIDGELLLFQSPVGGGAELPSNNYLRKRVDGQWVQDDFLHEQNLIIQTPGKSVLLVGCAHGGAGYILERAAELMGGYPDILVGGFHFLQGPGIDLAKTEAMAEALARQLLRTPTQCYTCHCTGPAAFGKMREIMGEQVKPLSTGDGFFL